MFYNYVLSDEPQLTLATTLTKTTYIRFRMWEFKQIPNLSTFCDVQKTEHIQDFLPI